MTQHYRGTNTYAEVLKNNRKQGDINVRENYNERRIGTQEEVGWNCLHYTSKEEDLAWAMKYLSKKFTTLKKCQ